MKFLIILFFKLILVNLGDCHPARDWFGEKWLDENYLFKWKTNHLEKVITIRVEVMTKGWVGFGFSKHGKFNEVDMAIGWVDDCGQSSLKDFWINEFGVRSLDMSQDWKLLSAEENATHSVLEFSRRFVTCDETNDLQIYENDIEMSNIVFSYSFMDPISDENMFEPIIQRIFYLNLFESPETFQTNETDLEFIDYWLNVTIYPGILSSHCVILKKFYTRKRQIVKYEIITHPSYDKMKIHHHFIWFDCDKTTHTTDDKIGKIFPCYDPKNELYSIRRKCGTSLLVSILNDIPVVFPNDIGITIDPAESPYFILEGHLLNPSDKVVDAKLAYRIWVTKKQRKLEASTLTIIASTGVLYSTFGIIVPPRQQLFRVSLVLSTYCFDQIENSGIFIFETMFHSHQANRLVIRHYRNDNLIRMIPYNHYDKEFQPYRRLKNHINLRKTDKIIVICEYNSINETKSFTSPYEHCAIVVYYYPAIKTKIEKTFSSRISYENMLKITGLEQIDGYDTELMENIIIRKPVEYNNTKLIDFISENKYKINDPKELEEFQISSDLKECCFYSDKGSTTNKPCRQISKPPGLYQSIKNERKENSCPSTQNFIENKLKGKIGIKIGLSLKTFY